MTEVKEAKKKKTRAKAVKAISLEEKQAEFIAECAQAYKTTNLRRLDPASITPAYVLNTICESIEACRMEGDSNGVYKGCELLGKHLKLFTDRAEITGSLEVGIKLPSDIPDE